MFGGGSDGTEVTGEGDGVHRRLDGQSLVLEQMHFCGLVYPEIRAGILSCVQSLELRPMALGVCCFSWHGLARGQERMCGVKIRKRGVEASKVRARDWSGVNSSCDCLHAAQRVAMCICCAV